MSEYILNNRLKSGIISKSHVNIDLKLPEYRLFLAVTMHVLVIDQITKVQDVSMFNHLKYRHTALFSEHFRGNTYLS